MYPETKREATLKQNRNGIIPNRETQTFTKDTADKIGVSQSTVEKEVKLANDLTDKAKEAVIKADITKTDAFKLARVNEDTQK